MRATMASIAPSSKEAGGAHLRMTREPQGTMLAAASFCDHSAVRVGGGPIALKAEPIEETQQSGVILA